MKLIVLGIIGLVSALLIGVMGDFTIPGKEGAPGNAETTANATADNSVDQFAEVGTQFSGMYDAFLDDIGSFQGDASASRADERYQSTLTSADQALGTFDNFSEDMQGLLKNVADLFGNAAGD